MVDEGSWVYFGETRMGVVVVGGLDEGGGVVDGSWLIAVIEIDFIHENIKYDQTMLQNE